MIALVSSTIAPSPLPGHDGPRTTFSAEERLRHTRDTIASLVTLGAREIVVADNSPGPWLRERAAELAPARVLHFSQPPVCNKGIGELWLLLGALDTLPADEPILKISGRYRVGPATGLRLRAGDDVAGKIYVTGRHRTLSTRCYLVRDRAVAARLWARTFDEIFAWHARIHGPRSFLRLLQNSLQPGRDHFRYGDPDTSVETAILCAIRHLPLRLHAVDNLAVEGVIGSAGNHPISE